MIKRKRGRAGLTRGASGGVGGAVARCGRGGGVVYGRRRGIDGRKIGRIRRKQIRFCDILLVWLWMRRKRKETGRQFYEKQSSFMFTRFSYSTTHCLVVLSSWETVVVVTAACVSRETIHFRRNDYVVFEWEPICCLFTNVLAE